MKMNIKGLVFVGFAAAVFASAANAADKIVTSKQYVDAKIQTQGNSTESIFSASSPDDKAPSSKAVYTALAAVDGTPYTGTAPVVVNAEDHKISVTIDGQVAQGNTGIVDGGTVYNYLTTNYDTAGEENVQANWTETNTSSDAYIQNKPTLGTAAAADTTTTIAENGTGLPTAGAVYNYLTTNYDTEGEENVQANWTETNTQSDAYILNKPTLGTAAALDSAATVTENGTGLPTAGAVYDFVTTNAAPSTAEENVQANWTETNTSSDAYIQNKPTLGTAAAADTTTTIAENGTGLPTAGAVYNFVTTPTNILPTNAECTGTQPCALVFDGANVTWEKIQQ